MCCFLVFFSFSMKSIKPPLIEICLNDHHCFWWLILDGTPAVAGRVVLEGEMSCWCLPATRSCLKGLRKGIEKPKALSCFAPLRIQGKILSPSVKAIKEKEGKSKEKKEGRKPITSLWIQRSFKSPKLNVGCQQRRKANADRAGTSKTCCAYNESWPGSFGGVGKENPPVPGACLVAWFWPDPSCASFAKRA